MQTPESSSQQLASAPATDVGAAEVLLPTRPHILRVVDTPAVVVSEAEHDVSVAGDELGALVTELGFERPFVVTSRHGAELALGIDGQVGYERPPIGPTQRWSFQLAHSVRRSGADSIVAIGGGRCLDIAKLAAAETGSPLVVVPTQLSHDGICSQVAVVPNHLGAAESLQAASPVAAFFPLPILIRSPRRSIRAGLADLMSNPLALRDWRLAERLGHDEVDPAAWHLSVESFQMIEPLLDQDFDGYARRRSFMGLLAHALANSGLAMMCAGSSRPASGAEHKISHAIDSLFGGRAMHGAQVAFGSIFSVALHGLDVDRFKSRLVHLGLPDHPRHLGLSHDELVEVLLRAPDMRERFTVLEHVALDHATASKLVTDLFGTW